MSEKYNYNRICTAFLLLIIFAIISVTYTEKKNKDKSEKFPHHQILSTDD